MPGRPKSRARKYTALELAAWELAARIRAELPDKYRAAAAGPMDWQPETEVESEWADATKAIREFERRIGDIACRAREKAGLCRFPLSWLEASELRDLLSELHLKLPAVILNDPGDSFSCATQLAGDNLENRENAESETAHLN